MSRHMVEEAGSRFLELASSFGRLHAETLSGLAEATAKTPFGPVFAINASLARMANDGIETLATRVGGAPAPKAASGSAPVVAKAPAPAKPEKPAPASAEVLSFKTPEAAESARSAPFAVETSPVTALADLAEPEVEDVLVDDAMVEDVLAEIEPGPVALADKDDLTRINGIGATTAKKLNGVGIESFAQIVGMSEAQFTDLLASLDIRTIRFSPAAWIAEARTLMNSGT